MLVSSIGYFDVKSNISHNENATKCQPKKSLGEGFGQYGKKSSEFVKTTGVVKRIFNAFKSLFVKNTNEDYSKYLSLVG